MSTPGAYAIFGVVSICLFFVVFGGAMLWAAVQPREHMRRMGDLPLRADLETEAPGTTTDSNHE